MFDIVPLGDRSESLQDGHECRDYCSNSELIN